MRAFNKIICALVMILPMASHAALSLDKCIADKRYYPSILGGKEYCGLKPIENRFFVSSDRATQFLIYKVTPGYDYQVQLTSSYQYTKNHNESGSANRYFRNNVLSHVKNTDWGWQKGSYDKNDHAWYYGLSTNLDGKAGTLVVKMSSFYSENDALAEIDKIMNNKYLGEELRGIPRVGQENVDHSILKSAYTPKSNYVLVQMTNPVPYQKRDASTEPNGTFVYMYQAKESYKTLGNGKGQLELMELSFQIPRYGDTNKSGNKYYYTFTFNDLQPDAFYKVELDVGRGYTEYFSPRSNAMLYSIVFTPFDKNGRPIGGFDETIGQYESKTGILPFIDNGTTKIPKNNDYRMPKNGHGLQITIKSNQEVVYDAHERAAIRLRLYKYSGN